MPIQSDDVIEIGEGLLLRHPDTFDDDFEANKRRVEELSEIRSRQVRNRVAGYVTRR